MTLKDINNIAGKAVPAYRNDFQELVKEMKKVIGEVSSLIYDTHFTPSR